ncbi:MAG TPA: nuclear transport factor 2 family protein [Solirubrobacteraceae bacterium]|nr:nuclear transport factor 2 family protein [Solirubrobacteraceae bacterium]
MSQANVELVRDAFQAFATEGIEAALSFFSPDFVWYPTDRWLDASAYRGHDGLRTLDAEFAANFEGYGYEVQDLRDAEDRVVALVYMSGRIKNSGQSVSQPLGLVVEDFHDRTLGQVRAFPSWREALKAVGLAE